MTTKSDSESVESPMKKEMRKAKEAQERAKAGFEYHSKKSSDAIYYWMVFGGFIVMCLACVYYVFREWRESPNLILAVNPIDIKLHNDKPGMPFLRGPNELFKVASYFSYYRMLTLTRLNTFSNLIFQMITRKSTSAHQEKTRLPLFPILTTLELHIRNALSRFKIKEIAVVLTLLQWLQ